MIARRSIQETGMIFSKREIMGDGLNTVYFENVLKKEYQKVHPASLRDAGWVGEVNGVTRGCLGTHIASPRDAGCLRHLVVSDNWHESKIKISLDPLGLRMSCAHIASPRDAGCLEKQRRNLEITHDKKENFSLFDSDDEFFIKLEYEDIPDNDNVGFMGKYLTRDNLIIIPNIDSGSNIVWDWLTYDALRSLYEENAGGNSLVSEALSIEYFTKYMGATNVSLEMEISYLCNNSNKVDFIFINGSGIRSGVSVTRAMAYPDPRYFTREEAIRLLDKKLRSLISAQSGIDEEVTFSDSYLHIWCQTDHISKIVESVYNNIDILEYGMVINGTINLVLTTSEWTPLYSNYYDSEYFGS